MDKNFGIVDVIFFPYSTINNRKLREKVRKKSEKAQEEIEVSIGKISFGAGKVVKKYNEVGKDIYDNLQKIEDNVFNVLEANSNLLISEYFIKDVKPSKGDHLYVLRKGFTHHGIYDGKGNVYEYKRQEGVIISNLSSFASGSKIRICPEKKSPTFYTCNEIIERAESRIGEENYNLFSNNCEQFARWCRVGEKNKINLKRNN